MTVLTIPAGYYGLLHLATIATGSGKEVNAGLLQRPDGGVWRIVRKGIVLENTSPWKWRDKRFEEKTDFEIRAYVAAAPTVIVTSDLLMTFVKLNNDVAPLSVPASIHFQES